MFDKTFVNELIAFRRDLHAHPELACEERMTAARISGELRSLGIEHRCGVGGTGIVALLGEPDRPCVAFRGDMDALPVAEAESEHNRDYRSRNAGIMHACGHDVHTTLVMGLARYLVRHPDLLDKSGVRVKLIFQPAEEGGGGAAAMIEDGCLKDPDVAAIFAQHCISELDCGMIGFCRGVSHAASDSLDIRITGKGGHAARPEEAIDPIVAGANLLMQMQTVISRSLPAREAAVVSIGKFQAGTRANVFPDEALLSGTIRTFNEQAQERIFSRIRELTAGLEVAFGVTTNTDIKKGYPPNVNDLDLCDFYTRIAAELLGDANVVMQPPSCGAEDFAYYTREIPGFIHRLGTRNKEKGLGWDRETQTVIGLHNSRFDVDEQAIFIGLRCWIEALRRASDLPCL